MNKLTKEKRNHLILVGIGTMAVLTLIIYGLIRPQYAVVKKINAQISAARGDLQSKKDTIKTANSVSNQLAELTDTLAQTESDMASGDPAVWIYDTIRNFKEHHKVDISVNSQLATGQVDLLPKFPYQQLKVTVNGTAFYHDFGKFIADFENAYPHARIVNLTLESAGGTGADSEKLAFRMDVIALIRTTGPQS